MANTLRFKRGLVATIPTALAGEPLFTTDTFDLYIGNGTGNTRFQKYIASGATTQILRGDGSLYTFPLAISSPSNGQVLKYNGTSWVNDSDAGITGSGSAGQVAYFTGATTQAGSNNLFWNTSTNRLGIGTNTPLYRLDVKGGNASTLRLDNDGSRYVQLVFERNTTSNSGADILLDGTNETFGIRTLATYPITFSTSATAGLSLERARIFATGNFGINTGASDNGLKLQVNGTGYFSGSVGIGTSSLTGVSLRVAKNVTGSGSTISVYNDGVIQSDSTSSTIGFYNVLRTQAASFNINFAYHFLAVQNALGAGSTITNQIGFLADSSLTSATNNYGFFGNIPSGTGRWNLYMNGSAANFLSGNTQIGTGALTSEKLQVNGTMKITGASSFGGNMTLSLNQNAVTSLTISNTTDGNTAGSAISLTSDAASGTLTIGKRASTRTDYKILGGGDAQIYNSSGDDIAILNDAATGNIKFAAGASSTAQMTLHNTGNLLVGSTSDSGERLQVTGTMKVTGASSFGGNMTLSLNQNAETSLSISNTTAGTTATTRLNLTSDSTAGSARLFKYSSLNTGYKTIAASDFGIFNITAGDISVLNDFATGNIKFAAGGSSTVQMLLNASGNLGLGVTPSAWDSTYKVYEAPGNAFFAGFSGQLQIGQNAYYSGAWKYKTTAVASKYYQVSGTHVWQTAPSGTADTNITYTQAMTLTAAGRLILGTGDSGELLQVNGTAKITGASNFSSTITAADTISSTDGTVNMIMSYGTLGIIGTQSNHDLILRTNATERLRISTTGAVSIVGNLTVDTNTLFVDATNNRVGIGTNGPSQKLHVVGAILNTAGFVLNRSDNYGFFTGASDDFGIYHDGTNSIISNATGALIFNNPTEKMRLDASGNLGIGMTPSYKLDVTGSARVSDAIAIGTTPDTNNPFKILKNINATVGIKFENTNTSSSAFSAVQLGTDVSGGTKFTNLVYSSSGVSQSGVYNPDGTSLINNGNGGLNFLGNPIRMYTGGSNGVLRWDLVSDGYITHYSATAPTTSATDGYRQYSADVVAGNAAPHFRTENGAVIKLYQETTAVGNAIVGAGGGSAMLDDDTFDGYTLRQIVRALRNQGILQ